MFLNNTHINALLQAAKELSDVDRHPSANNLHVIVIKNLENNPDEIRRIGVSLFSTDQLDQAFLYFEKANEIEPNNPTHLFNLAICCFRTNNYERATNLLTTANNITPKNSEILINLALCYQKEGDIDKAINCFEEACEIEPRDIDILIDLSFCYRKKQDYETALDYIEKAIDVAEEMKFSPDITLKCKKEQSNILSLIYQESAIKSTNFDPS